MKLETIKQKLIGDERAVSPVIGVILMVAITVILAAVIGTFVLGLGENVSQTTPQTSMSFSDASETHQESDGNVQDFATIEHTSGDPVEANQVKINIRNADTNDLVASFDGNSWTSSISGATFNDQLNGGAAGSFQGSTASVGDVVTITAEDDGTTPIPNDRYKITVIHKPSDSTLASGTVTVS